MRVQYARFVSAVGFAAVLCSSLVLTGCGGSGHSTTTEAAFPFAGTFSGPFTFTASSAVAAEFPNQTGTISVTINSSGALTGTGNDVTLAQTLTSTGTVSSTGNLNASFVLPGAGVTATITGPVSIASNGHLVGTVAETVNGTNVGTLAVDLTKQ